MSVAIKDLFYAWNDSETPFLSCERFEVKTREKIFLHGPSGSGKTTLLGLLGGVLTPQRGTINLLGHAINRLSGSKRDQFRADHIGFIFQMFNLLPYLSVMDNVILALKFSKSKKDKTGNADEAVSEAGRLLAALGLKDRSLYHRGVHSLSVGQQQRVAAARALIGAPEIVVADEPTSALDADSRKAFLDLLFEEVDRASATLIYVSHDSGVSENFDRTVAIKEFHHQK